MAVARYVAVEHLKIGDEIVQPGEILPVDESRDYDTLVLHGQAARVEGDNLVENTTKRKGKSKK